MKATAARRRFGATRGVFILAMLTVVGPCAGADSHLPEEVLARVQALDRIVQERLELVRLNLESGTLNRERAAGDLERLEANLAALGDAVRGLPPGERERLGAKLHALSLQLENLRLASLGTTPSLPGHRERRALRVGGGPDGAAQNDACAQALIVEVGETYEGDSSTATNDGQASCGASLLSPDVWFRYVPATAGQVAVDTLGSSYDTVLSVHSACPGTVANELECNDDIQGLQSGVSFAVVAGYQ